MKTPKTIIVKYNAGNVRSVPYALERLGVEAAVTDDHDEIRRADKVSVNSAAVLNPALITDIAKRFGSQCVVLAIDTNREEGEWLVYLNGGRIRIREWRK